MSKSEIKLPNHHYKAFNVTPAKNAKLSPGAKGVMYYLLSQDSETWKGHVYDIVNNMNASEYAIKKYIKELVAIGYVQRKFIREDGEFKGSYYIVKDELRSN